ncbi:MAG TPA: endopeptidase La [Gammaproteobacteria bacterium]|nr:endopeptidase La [Gammaproteobacteria bacterium]
MNEETRSPQNEAPETSSVSLPEDVLLVVPVRNVVMFPGQVTQVALGRDISMRAAQEAVQHGHKLGIVLQRDPSVDEPGPDDLYKIGTTVTVVRYLKAPNGMHHLICQGEQRFRVVDYLNGLPFLAARFDLIADQPSHDPGVEARATLLKQKEIEAIELLPQVPPELAPQLQALESPGALADMVAGLIDIKPSEKQAVLEALKVRDRLDAVIEHLTHRVEVLKITREIGEQTQGKIDERQREYLLREQLKTIKKELGEDETQDELDELREQIAKGEMPEEVQQQAKKELRRLENMPEASTENSMVRTYLDWIVALPWSKLDEENIDIAKAREILDADHYGLAKVKRRILEYLAVRKLNSSGRSPILCFVGPPGVGKTSLGQSIARALGLKFVRSSLGGVHDEAEIRGHRRTYIGSMPGNIIQSLRKAGTRNPVFMLDEMDKLGVGFHGDPSSALLEVLDPEQNSTFRDHYLDLPFDLSKVLFVGTANVLENIPGPLRDRMEIIELPGYTQEEKLAIATKYLVQRQLTANGLRESQVTVSEAAIAEVIDGYTREAGVRNLERGIGALLRHAAMRIAEGTADNVAIDAGDVAAILGARRFENEVKQRTSVPGVATGLAWTPVGGDILFIEASLVPGKGQLILTGQLGEVMKESAQAAVSLAKMRLDKLGAERSALETNDLHIHIPAGAIPKDGPSAGVAMFLAVASLLSGRTVRPDIAMTGEISLRGLVLPIGGVKEKTLAALRAGIDTVMLPERNRKDLEEIPETARKQLKFVWLENIDDALNAALETRGRAAQAKGGGKVAAV